MVRDNPVKIGFIEPSYSKIPVAFNKHVKRALEKSRYIPLWNVPNLALLTTAAMVPEDWEVKYIGSVFNEIDYSESFDIIAVGGMTRQAKDMYVIAQKFKQKGTYIVIGGIHATVLPEEVKNYADTVIVGEAEEIFPKFIDDFCNNKAKPFYRSTTGVDITKSPIPRFDLLRKSYRTYPIQTTRGCPHDCKFCVASRVYGKKFRHKEVDQVIEEIKVIKSIKSNPFVDILDDNMLADRSFSYRLLEKMIPLKIHWWSQTDISVGKDKELLKLLHKAGCKELLIGLESVEPEKIEDINKSRWKAMQVAEYKTLIKNIQDYGIRMYGAFFLGFDKDTKQAIDRVADFVVENNMFGLFTILTPLPGTALYDEFKRSGRILENKSWEYFNFLDCVIRHPHLTADELEQGIARLLNLVYSREHYSRVLSHLIRVHRENKLEII